MDKTFISMGKKIPAVGRLSTRGLLVGLSNAVLGNSWIIDREQTLIGRGESAQVVLNDPEVSKEHCRIIVEKDTFYLEDLDSTNHTFLNGKLLKKRREIQYGDRLVMGSVILRFFFEEQL